MRKFPGSTMLMMYPSLDEVEALDIPQCMDAFQRADHQQAYYRRPRTEKEEVMSSTILFLKLDPTRRCNDLFETGWTHGCGSNVFEPLFSLSVSSEMEQLQKSSNYADLTRRVKALEVPLSMDAFNRADQQEQTPQRPRRPEARHPTLKQQSSNQYDHESSSSSDFVLDLQCSEDNLACFDDLLAGLGLSQSERDLLIHGMVACEDSMVRGDSGLQATEIFQTPEAI
jgi:hypothetical protein